MEPKYTLVDNPAEGRYEFVDENCAAENERPSVEYELAQKDVIILTRTYVPEALSGRGIAKRLVEAVLTDISQKPLRVVPQCDFIAHYILHHPQWEKLL